MFHRILPVLDCREVYTGGAPDMSRKYKKSVTGRTSCRAFSVPTSPA